MSSNRRYWVFDPSDNAPGDPDPGFVFDGGTPDEDPEDNFPVFDGGSVEG